MNEGEHKLNGNFELPQDDKDYPLYCIVWISADEKRLKQAKMEMNI